jgi:BlaI family penicillinase repressor
MISTERSEGVTKRAKDLPDLSPAEWDVMKVVWDDGPLAARDVYARLKDGSARSYPTVKTLLRRIVSKGWLAYEQIGNSYLYRAAVPREKAMAAAVKDFSSRVLDGVLAPFVAYFVAHHDLTEEDIDEIEKIVRARRRKEGKAK